MGTVTTINAFDRHGAPFGSARLRPSGDWEVRIEFLTTTYCATAQEAELKLKRYGAAKIINNEKSP